MNLTLLSRLRQVARTSQDRSTCLEPIPWHCVFSPPPAPFRDSLKNSDMLLNLEGIQGFSVGQELPFHVS